MSYISVTYKPSDDGINNPNTYEVVTFGVKLNKEALKKIFEIFTEMQICFELSKVRGPDLTQLMRHPEDEDSESLFDMLKRTLAAYRKAQSDYQIVSIKTVDQFQSCAPTT